MIFFACELTVFFLLLNKNAIIILEYLSLIIYFNVAAIQIIVVHRMKIKLRFSITTAKLLLV